MSQITGVLGDYIESFPNGTTPVQEFVLTTDASYQVPAGRLLTSIVATPSVDTALRVGSYVGAGDIQPLIDIPSGQSVVINVNLYAVSGQMIFFSGITASTQVKIFLS